MYFEMIIEKLIDWALTHGIRLVIGIVLLLIGWKLIKKFVRAFEKLSEKKSIDSTLHMFLSGFIEIASKILLILIILNYVGFDTASLAAVFASAGLALGLALQGSLSNFAGGIIILFMRPFSVNDYVKAGEYEGKVEKIQLFYTHLITVDNKVVLIPNGTLANGNIINYSAMETRRVDVNVGVDYSCDIIQVKNAINSVIDANPLILKVPEPFVALNEHGDSSLNFVVRVWTDTANYWKVYFYLMEQVKIKFDEEGISIPYPHMDLNIINNNSISNK